MIKIHRCLWYYCKIEVATQTTHKGVTRGCYTKLGDSPVLALKHQKTQAQAQGHREGASSLHLTAFEGGQVSSIAPTKEQSTSSAQGRERFEPVEGSSAPSAEDPVPQYDKGKSPIGDFFLNNPNSAFKRITRVVPKGDINALQKFSSSDINQRFVLNLT